MPAQPTNCYICKNTWLGAGLICDNCSPPITAKPTFIPWCSFCGGRHDEADCLAGAVTAPQQKQQQYQPPYNMARKPIRRSKPFTNYYNAPTPPPLKLCSKCNQHATVETKAGSICTSCKALTRNPCRNCTSTNTHGLSGDTIQFIECNDCQFIE